MPNGAVIRENTGEVFIYLDKSECGRGLHRPHPDRTRWPSMNLRRVLDNVEERWPTEPLAVVR
ncbi:hypothetical protein [Gordonia sp. (in: high G+C Gram-positive bacteria)]|uniref:hypothetical protein n=1 Tax=Gordonia sp. (in: high G+C Gram-positive bacteria) TaxID=84139 RepID=UPI0039E65CB8